MANLSKIKELSKSKNIPIKQIAETIGVTEQGLHKMIREQTMTAVNLEKVAKCLGANICTFFDVEVTERVSEHYESFGERGILAKKIQSVDNRNTSSNVSSSDIDKLLSEKDSRIADLQASVDRLSKMNDYLMSQK